MLRLLQILLFSMFSVFSIPQSISDNFTINYPDFVKKNSNFQVSIITSNEFINADKLDLYIIPHSGITVQKILIHNSEGFTEIPFSKASSEGYLYDAVMADVFFNTIEPNSNDSFFQLLIEFKTRKVDYSEIEFYGEFIKEGSVIDYLQSSNNELEGEYPNQYSIKINFYEPTSISGNALKLEENSSFAINNSDEISNNLCLNFWFKNNNAAGKILQITNQTTSLNEFEFTINDYQILSTESDFYNIEELNPVFLSNDVWYNFTITVAPLDKKLQFFCNKQKVAQFDYSNLQSLSDLSFQFSGILTGSFSIDLIRLIDFTGDLQQVWRNSNFPTFLSDSADLKLQVDFDGESLSKMIENNIIIAKNYKLIKSDAPIFNRAPDLNLEVYSNFISLQWKGGDVENADSYEIEKSTDGLNFVKIGSIQADNSKKQYSYSTEKSINDEIVYYRIKQINKNGDEIYSVQIKVGQGNTEDFIIQQNYPNPFNPVTQISVELLQDTELEVVVYNLEGQTIEVLHKGFLPKGFYTFEFDGSELPSGIYLYKISTPNFSQIKKMILAK